MIKDIIGLCRNPYQYVHAGAADTTRTKITILKNSLILCICASFLLTVIIKLVIESIFNTSISQSHLVNDNNFREVNTFSEALLKICVFGPFEEEVLFRLILITRSYFFENHNPYWMDRAVITGTVSFKIFHFGILCFCNRGTSFFDY